MILSLDGIGDEVRRQAEVNLNVSFNTSYGVGRILNSILFEDARVLPESLPDMWRTSAPAPVYSNSVKAIAFFAVILFHSPFADSVVGSSDAFSNCYMARLQRFCFKLCEIRKAECNFRFKYYRVYQCKSTRVKELQLRLLLAHGKVRSPCFAKRTSVTKRMRFRPRLR